MPEKKGENKKRPSSRRSSSDISQQESQEILFSQHKVNSALKAIQKATHEALLLSDIKTLELLLGREVFRIINSSSALIDCGGLRLERKFYELWQFVLVKVIMAFTQWMYHGVKGKSRYGEDRHDVGMVVEFVLLYLLNHNITIDVSFHYVQREVDKGVKLTWEQLKEKIGELPSYLLSQQTTLRCYTKTQEAYAAAFKEFEDNEVQAYLKLTHAMGGGLADLRNRVLHFPLKEGESFLKNLFCLLELFNKIFETRIRLDNETKEANEKFFKTMKLTGIRYDEQFEVLWSEQEGIEQTVLGDLGYHYLMRWKEQNYPMQVDKKIFEKILKSQRNDKNYLDCVEYLARASLEEDREIVQEALEIIYDYYRKKEQDLKPEALNNDVCMILLKVLSEDYKKQILRGLSAESPYFERMVSAHAEHYLKEKYTLGQSLLLFFRSNEKETFKRQAELFLSASLIANKIKNDNVLAASIFHEFRTVNFSLLHPHGVLYDLAKAYRATSKVNSVVNKDVNTKEKEQQYYNKKGKEEESEDSKKMNMEIREQEVKKPSMCDDIMTLMYEEMDQVKSESAQKIKQLQKENHREREEKMKEREERVKAEEEVKRLREELGRRDKEGANSQQGTSFFRRLFN